MAHGVDARSVTEPDDVRLSVLVPCWNASATIERALTSVLAERDVALECIVIDDGSTDGTAEILESFARRDPRVVVLRLPTNGGVSNARNQGLASARGEWIAFHDADDRMCPGGLAALMRPTADPAVLAVIGQRVWTDGERTWLAAIYDNPDIRQPGRKSIATHPGLLYTASAIGKAFHRSLLRDLWFEGRVLGDQPWTIRALLRAGGQIEVVGETVFEWSRVVPERFVPTITSLARASATSAAEMTAVAGTVFREVCDGVDAEIDDEAARRAIKRAYFDRMLRSDLGGPVRTASQSRDPETARLFEAVIQFLDGIPPSIVRGSEILATSVLRPPAVNWGTLVRSAREPYWRMVRVADRIDPRMSRRIAWRRSVEPAFVFARLGPPVGPGAASAVLSTAVVAKQVAVRLRSIGR